MTDEPRTEVRTQMEHELAREFVVKTWTYDGLGAEEGMWNPAYADVALFERGKYEEHCPTCRCHGEPERVISLREAMEVGLIELWLQPENERIVVDWDAEE